MGVLADGKPVDFHSQMPATDPLTSEMGLGKTIEMLSLIHSHRTDLGGSQPERQSVNSLPRLPKRSASVEKAPATTLVVAPMSLLAQWQSEAEKASTPGTLKTLVYYGSDKNINLQALCCEENVANAPNVVITSYGVVLSEFNQVAALGGNRGSHGGLFSLDYFRVILDEAHFIKNRLSKTAKACFEIMATHRWVLDGNANCQQARGFVQSCAFSASRALEQLLFLEDVHHSPPLSQRTSFAHWMLFRLFWSL